METHIKHGISFTDYRFSSFFSVVQLAELRVNEVNLCVKKATHGALGRASQALFV